jgi:hypothetical protein
MNENATLKFTKPMMHGPAVVRLQELGDLLECDIGPNDGIFGIDTQAVVLKLQARFGLAQDGVCGPKTWATILQAADEALPTEGEPHPLGDLAIDDRRGKHPHPKLYKCPRPWDGITGVTLHQTGCSMPSRPSGWDRLNAHIGITQEGLCILVNDPRDWIWHAQGLSKQTIGIEIEGNYAGITGHHKTLWKGGGGPAHLNPKMMAAMDRAFAWLQNEFEQHGQKWEHVFAHRQSAPSRIADPGQEIWQAVAIPWMTKLGAFDGGPTFRRGSGRPIPKEWDIARPSRYWDK